MLVRPTRNAVVVHAPAKLNLFLEIVSRRSDGYHDLESLMLTVSLYDTLTVASDSSPGVQFSWSAGCHSDLQQTVPSDSTNLVVRAASALTAASGTNAGAKIHLHKRIPTQSGLGGGSSDAAATLIALNHIWNLGWSRTQLCELAATLGSDIPFFVSGHRAAICRGRGELIEPVEIPAGLHCVITRPDGGLSTAEVYRNCTPAKQPESAKRLVSSLQSGKFRDAGKLLYNALEAPALRLNSSIEAVRSRYAHESLYGHAMTGSGSAYFGLCAGRRQALAVATRLNARRVGHSFAVQCRP